MTPPRRLLVMALLIAPACGGGGGGEDLLLWEQVFTTWSCTAAGRPAFSFEVARLSEFGSDHEWSDLGGGTTQPAFVSFTDLYLKNPDGSALRNFELIPNQPEVLDHLEEWSLTAGTDAPYVCTTP